MADRLHKMEVLVFRFDGARFALRSDEVHGVAQVPEIVPLPGAPAAVEGVVNVHGASLPVYDLRPRFGLAPAAVEPSQHLIVARAAERQVAFRADEVMGIVSVSEAAADPIDTVVEDDTLLSAVVRLPDGLVLIPDLGRFLNDEELSLLDTALETV